MPTNLNIILLHTDFRLTQALDLFCIKYIPQYKSLLQHSVILHFTDMICSQI
jgi:hypothetical protein